MYGRQPLNDLQLLTCPKCGAPQESSGSTFCELCGAALRRSPATRPAARPVLRLKHLLRVPAQRFIRGAEAFLVTVSLVVRAGILVLLLASLVMGSSFVPEVNALIPATKTIAAAVKPWFQRAEKWGGRLLAGWEAEPSSPRAPIQSAIRPRTLAPVHFAATQAVLITSTPGGATIQVNARRMGKTPMTLRLAPGTYKVTISRPGYATVSRTITVGRGKGTSLGVKLDTERPSPSQPVPVPGQPQGTSKREHKSKGDGPLSSSSTRGHVPGLSLTKLSTWRDVPVTCPAHRLCLGEFAWEVTG